MWTMHTVRNNIIPDLLCCKLTETFLSTKTFSTFPLGASLRSQVFFPERRDFAILGILACVSGYLHVARSKTKPGARGLTIPAGGRKPGCWEEPRPERSSEIWRGTVTQSSQLEIPCLSRGESQAPVGWLVYFVFWNKQQTKQLDIILSVTGQIQTQ